MVKTPTCIVAGGMGDIIYQYNYCSNIHRLFRIAESGKSTKLIICSDNFGALDLFRYSKIEYLEFNYLYDGFNYEDVIRYQISNCKILDRIYPDILETKIVPMTNNENRIFNSLNLNKYITVQLFGGNISKNLDTILDIEQLKKILVSSRLKIILLGGNSQGYRRRLPACDDRDILNIPNSTSLIGQSSRLQYNVVRNSKFHIGVHSWCAVCSSIFNVPTILFVRENYDNKGDCCDLIKKRCTIYHKNDINNYNNIQEALNKI